MIARYDDEQLILTPGFIEALKNFMREEMAMMRLRDTIYADCWTWGRCTITDLANSGGIQFEFGSDEDKPHDIIGDVQIRTAAQQDAPAPQSEG